MEYDDDSVWNWIVTHKETLLNNGTFNGVVIELMVGGENYVGKPKYDYTHSELGKVELKSTTKPQARGKTLRIQNYQSKRNGFDHMHIVDRYNNREFIIPHDIWFTCVGKKGMFWWSASYNKTDKAQIENTEFLLQYEVK